MTDEAVERVAQIIHEAMRFEREGDTLAWVHKGNSKAQDHARSAARAALDAMPAVGVRQLEWEDYPADDGPILSKAVAIHGTYFIVDDTYDFSGLYLELISHDDARWWQSVRSTCETLMERVHDDDLAPIKASAQADYERRIRSALTPAPDPVAEAARVLLEAEVYPEQYATYGNDRTDRYAKGFCGGVEAFKDALRALTKGGE